MKKDEFHGISEKSNRKTTTTITTTRK